jgi:hypothetical protein
MVTRIDRADGGFAPRSLLADPHGHADLLIGTLGFATALEMADLYARQWPASLYWTRVLAALRDRRPKDTAFDDPRCTQPPMAKTGGARAEPKGGRSP